VEKANRVLVMDDKLGNVIPIKTQDRRQEEALDALELFQERIADAVVEAYASPITFEALAVMMVRFISVNYYDNSHHKDPYGFIRHLSHNLVDEYEAVIDSMNGDGDDV
jgi:hypothetical protein